MKNTLKYLFVALFFMGLYLSFVSYSNENKYMFNDEKLEKYYQKHKGNDIPSVSVGTVSKGSIKNAKLLPFSGANYEYFDKWSYLQGRAFLHGSVLNSVLNSYSSLNGSNPGRKFRVMECSHQKGGKLWPHRTHQNGLSVDFMMPLKKDDKPYYGLDSKGVKHYLLEFDNAGKYEKDKSVQVDFDLVAKHILQLNASARKQGYKIKKVIIKIEFKDDLYATKHGKKLKQQGIYVVMGLTPKINELHDDHYHIDFVKI
ncbi:MAG: penicillin-insensitive murein endopeptidase [Glaciecola sp.]|jgi:penicillin-insensitive murein endopeptidase